MIVADYLQLLMGVAKSLSWAQLPLLLWLLVELAFYVIATEYIHPMINKLTSPPDCPIKPKEAFKKILDAVTIVKDVYPFEKLVEGWFRGSRIDEIYEENFKSFLAWAGWHRRYSQLTDEDQVVVNETLEYIKQAHDHTFRPGYNPLVNHMPFSLEPVKMAHVPLAVYAINALFHFLGGLYLRAMGFTRYHTSQGVVYWHRPASITNKSQEEDIPLLFFHGVGPGLWIYLPLLKRVSSNNRTCVYVEIRHITTTLTFNVPRGSTIVKAIEELTSRHNINEFCATGHSFGSIVAGWMAKNLPHRVKKLVLIDPVSLLLCMPEVTSGFFYSKPTLENCVDFSKEVTIANALKRNFWWYEKVLWAEDIQCPVVVALSGRDHIVPSAATKVYMEKMHPQSRVLYWPEFGHGHVLVHGKQQDELAKAMMEEIVSIAKDEDEDDLPPAAQEMILKLTKSLSERIVQRNPNAASANTKKVTELPSWEVTTEDASSLLKSLDVKPSRTKAQPGALKAMATNKMQQRSVLVDEDDMPTMPLQLQKAVTWVAQ